MNGEVVASYGVSGSFAAEVTRTVPIRETSWIAVRHDDLARDRSDRIVMAQHRALDLTAANLGFGQRLDVVSQGVLQGVMQILGAFYPSNSN